MEERTKTGELIRAGYDAMAERYQKERSKFQLDAELEQFMAHVPTGGAVLDVGCGTGLPATKILVEHGFRVTGTDFSSGMLALAEKNVPSAKFVEMDLTKLTFGENSFDGITAFYSIIHVPREKHRGILKDFHRILKPDGMLLACLGGKTEWEGTEEYLGKEMFWSCHSPEKELQQVKDAGFDVIFNKLLTRGGETHFWVLAKNVK